jgi:MoxR-like ATPase
VRELSDALRRRCLYHYLDYPDAQRERDIVKAKLPDIDHHLNRQLVNVVQKLRGSSMRKAPGVAETLDWAASLMQLNIRDLAHSVEQVQQTLTCLIKTREDRAFIGQDDVELSQLFSEESP